MSEELNKRPDDDLVIDGEYLLTDENGVEKEFILIGHEKLDGGEYLAFIPKADDDNDEYVILKITEEDGEVVLATIDDDDEFDNIAAIFDDSLFAEEE